MSANTSRREFLVGAGHAIGLSALPFGAAVAAQDWDVIVVGGGTAGLPTALFAAERGRVLIIEKGPMLGGTLDRSTGQVAAAGTVFQQAKGIEDTPDAHYDDIMRINDGTSDPVLTRLLVDNAADSLNWLAQHGFEVLPEHPLTGHGHDHFRTARYQWGPQNGWSIFNAMKPLVDLAIAKGRLQVQLNTRAVDLIQDGSGAVVGVVAAGPDGERSDFRARNVVLASGGCASNPHMYEELHGVPLYCQIAHPNSQGDGLTLGLAAGGYLRGGEKYATLLGAILANDHFPSPPSAIPPLNPNLRKPWEILVNFRGERFVREDHPSINHLEHALAEQPGHRHWAIFDQAILDTAPPLVPDWTAQQVMDACDSHPMFSSAENLRQLGVTAGLNPRQLVKTVDAYNDALVNERPDPFGLTHRPLPIAKPPYYAIRMHGWSLISFAGLGVNGNLQATTAEGKPVPNLYAAGEIIGAGATSGAAYTNGMLVTPALTFGRLLGQRILDFS
ncbi:MAG: FAD-dependent oxidoreductase [Gammaproteobacteria bacterium]|nr:FAD-dependent oxidoreductase [Gammaproteobacteria bacterium]